VRARVTGTLYARAVGRRDKWRDGERGVITVTPVSAGVVRPVLFTLVSAALVVEAGRRFALVHRFADVLWVVVVLPAALASLARIAAWRSHKIRVTDQRVLVEGGVLNHYEFSVELADVFATRVDQRVHERIARRGVVVLETTGGGPIQIGRVRQPGALCRLIDAERVAQRPAVALDAVYTYDEPDPFPGPMRPETFPRRSRFV
jgi:uncharacterized membrane protein YdbT with pleckstrin-like domain